MDEFLGAIIVATSLQEINQTIKSKGFNDFDDLTSAIRQLDIEIAKAKDAGNPYGEMLKLRDEYINLQNQYIAAYNQEQERKKKNNAIGIAVFVSIIVIALIILFVFLFREFNS